MDVNKSTWWSRVGLVAGRSALTALAVIALTSLTGCPGDSDNNDVVVNNDNNNDENNDQPTCGDGICGIGEDADNCPDDCDDDAGPECGNGTCEEGETPDNCAQDCEEDGPECGDGVCDEGETPENCAADCEEEEGCAEDDDCGPGSICEDNVCIDGCRLDSDCAQNELCIDNACLADACREDGDCPGGEICDEANNICVEDMGQCLPDGNESNDNTGEATDLGEGTFENLSICEADNDYFAYTLEPGGTLTVSIATEAALNLQIVDEDSQPVANSQIVDGGREATFTSNAGGAFFARVFATDNDLETTGEYTLTAAINGGDDICNDDASEPNNSSVDATLLDTNGLQGQVSCSGDSDFYSFTLLPGESGTVAIDFDNEAGDLTLVLYDTDGMTELDRSEGDGDIERVTANSPEGGTFVVEVISARETGGSVYNVALTVGEASDCPLDEFEPNNESENASTVEPGTYEGLQVCSDEADFYAIPLGFQDTVDITLNFVDADGDIDMTLRNFFGDFIASSTGVSDSENITEEVEAAGIYILEVRVLGGVDNTYDMTIGVTPGPDSPECADDFEPNNDADAAAAFPEEGASGVACPDDPDFFSFEVGSDNALVEVEGTYGTPFGDVNLALIDTDGTTVLAETQGPGETELLRGVAPVPGTYYIRTNIAAGGNTEYTITLDVTECADNFEPNNDADNAGTFSENLVEDALACANDPDFYAIEVTAANSFIEVAGLVEDGFGDIALKLYDTDGTTVLDETEGEFTEDLVSALAPAAGTYFVEVTLLSGINTPYNLELDLLTPPECVDANEPNDDINTPTTVELDGSVDAATACVGDVDFYELLVVEPFTEVTVTADFDNQFGDIDMEIIDSDGVTVLASAEGPGAGAEATFLFENTGAYFVRVFLADGIDTPYSLSLENEVRLNCEDILEPNNTADEAEVLTFGTRIEGLTLCDETDEVDFFTFTLEETAVVDITLLFLDAPGDIDMRLLDADEATVASAVSSSDNETISRELEPGTYFVRVFILGFNTENTYDMIFSEVTAAECIDLNEPNDDSVSATALDFETVDAVACVGESDFYAVVVEEVPSEIRVRTNFNNTFGDVDLELIDVDGVTVLETADGTGNTENLDFDAPAPGTYFVRAFLKDGGENVAYGISATVVGVVSCDDEFEGNNTVADAVDIAPGSYDELSVCRPDDEFDFYTLYLEAGDAITVDVLFVDADGDIDIALLDTNGTTTIDSSASTTDNEQVEGVVEADGFYFIRVRMFTTNARNGYQMIIDAPERQAPICEDDLNEDDDDALTATILDGEITGRTACAGDEDWFRVNVPQGFILDANLFFTHADGDMDLTLFDTDGETELVNVNASDDEINNERLIFRAITGGDYFLRARTAGRVDNTYSISVNLLESLPVEECVDQFEPNNSIGAAAPVEAGVYEGLDLCDGPDALDFYAVEVGPNSILNITVEYPAGDIRLRVFGPDQETELINENVFGTIQNARIITSDDNGGTYYIQVEDDAFFPADVQTYDMTITLEDNVCEDDGREDDDAPFAGQLLEPGTYSGQICSGDTDFIQFIANGGGETLQADLAFIDADGDLGLRLYDQDGTTVLAEANSATDNERILQAIEEAGIYFLEVFGDGLEQNAYELTFEFVDICNDEFEPNNSFEEAAVITAGTYEDLDLCRPDTDPNDFFAIDLLAGQTINITVNFIDAEGDIDITLFDIDEVELDRSSGVIDTENVTATVDADTTVFLQVRLFTNNVVNNYSMTVEITDAE